MTLKKIDLNDLPENRRDLDKLVVQTARANFNQPETELVFARALRYSMKMGDINIGDIEEDLADTWIKQRTRSWGDDNYYEYIDRRSSVEDSLNRLFHLEISQRFARFALKAIKTSRRYETETARRKKAVAA